ncbi:phospholipase/carboxylesterase [Hyphomonas polymorpha PS728]|uniref:Phospholipase/carboxylesterase n=1 Tax=Hyphomonas polymorpha PS728 TaxID=1280954 RepID=A0A062VLV3_9PROT|nr:hypothetical protein [Hyphomonas polymorpha]KCZ99645.1 phospholipase/carboxylesterase [Hyphomonas polymorpha PS728]
MSRNFKLICTVHGPSEEEAIANAVILHGLGQTEDIVFEQLKGAIPPGVRVLALQAPFPFGPASDAGYAWFNIDIAGAAGPPRPDLAQESFSRQIISDFVDTLAPRLPRILFGFGQGGVMAVHLYLQRPESMQLCIAASARVMPHLIEEFPPGPRHQGVPVIWVHGESDPVIPFESARASVGTLTAAGTCLKWITHRGGHEWPGHHSQDVMLEIERLVRQGRSPN